MGVPLNYSLKSLWLRRTTAVATAAGIGLLVFVLASSLMLAGGLRQTLLSAGNSSTALVMQVDAYSEGDSRIRQSALGLVQAHSAVRRDAEGRPLVAGESITHVILPHANTSDVSRQASVQVRGMTESSFRLRPEVRIIEGRRATPGTTEAVVGEGLHGRYQGLQVGEGFELGKNRRVQIVGVFEAGGSAYESEVWVDLDMLRTSFGWEGYLSSVTAHMNSASAYTAFAAAMEQDKRLGLSVSRERDYYEKVSNRLSSVISGLGSVVTFIFSFGAMLGAAITMYGTIGHRRREIGVLKALGFRSGHVLLAFLVEALSLSLIGGAAGVGLAMLTPFLHFSAVNWATGQELAFRFLPQAKILYIAVSVGAAVGVLGGFFPALSAARMDPVRAMRR